MAHRRGDWLGLLRGAADKATLHAGRSVSSFEEGGDGVVATLDDGSTLEGDVLVGADGMFSRWG
jgi:salicylate hydroxylase